MTVQKLEIHKPERSGPKGEGVKVGATAIDADEKAAEASIFGYTVANDVSGRAAQLQSATLSTGQWALGKNVDKSCPIGSFIITADAISVANLKLETIVDGQVMQSGTTAEMVFNVPQLIAFASRTSGYDRATSS
jgi:2-keto-4-pentenoate hydratase/2-oxohepta-3-ene-1,7-dioic acid hydratase in catechol pathway